MGTSSVHVEVQLNDNPPIPAKLVIEDHCEVTESLSPRPDERWSFVDNNGHFHAYSTKGRPYPTLVKSRWECAVCSVKIEPGMIPGPHTVTIPGLTEWSLELAGFPEPIMGRVTVRARSGDREWFGLGMVVSATFDAVTGDPRGKVQGFGPLGQRTVKGVEVPVQRNGEDPEIKAMRDIAAVLDALDPVVADRVVRWALSRYMGAAKPTAGGGGRGAV